MCKDQELISCNCCNYMSLTHVPSQARHSLWRNSCSRRAVVSYWRKYVHEVLVNRLGCLSLPRKSVVRLTDRPDMTLDVNRGRGVLLKKVCKIYTSENSILSCDLCFALSIDVIVHHVLNRTMWIEKSVSRQAS